jgi:hypothetical protein
VISENSEGVSGVRHASNDLQGFPDLRSAVDEVADENHASFRVFINAVPFRVAEFFQ